MSHQRNRWRRLLQVLALAVIFSGAASVGAGACPQPVPVCAARDAVFAIAAFDPLGSAVRIGPHQLVTARHVVADDVAVQVRLGDGASVTATVVPTDYLADVILLEAPDLAPGPVLETALAVAGQDVFTVGAQPDGGIRAYDPGEVRRLPAAGKPLARLHHSAPTEPGNSGGALVDAEGRLVGIVASGGHGRIEAVPAPALRELRARSGPARADRSAEIGAAVRGCIERLEGSQGVRAPIAAPDAQHLARVCRQSGNRQLLALAGQVLATRGRPDTAIPLFEASLDQDPNTINGRIGLAIAYHMAARYPDALPHLHWLLARAGDDPEVLRLAIQAGTRGGDPALAQAAFEALQRIDRQGTPGAARFLRSQPPQPQ